MPNKLPKIGGHVSAAVSLELAFDRAANIGAEVFQFFISPPQQWFQTKHDDEEVTRFLAKSKETGIETTFIHGTYLVNLGTENPEHLKKSEEWLIYALNLASKLQAKGVIFHLGSHKGKGLDAVLPQVTKTLKKVLEESSKMSSAKPYLILENAAGAGGVIGAKFSELGKILKAVDNPRLKICLDTQHAFAAGYDVKEMLGLKDVLEEFDLEIGIDNLVAIHANDSKVEYGANRDRHENIGEGFIGKEGFENMINHPMLKNVAFILEVPGFTGSGPDKENVDILKNLRKA